MTYDWGRSAGTGASTRIVIDLQSCQSGSMLGGIGRYSLDLAKAMAKEPDREVIILLNDIHRAASEKLRRELIKAVPQSNILEFKGPLQQAHVRNRPAQRKMAELLREKFIADLQPDVVHVSSLFEGLADDVVMTIPSECGYLNAVTLYDLIPLVNKEKYLTTPESHSHYFEKLEHLRRAQLLLAISAYSAQEGRALLKGYRGEIENIAGGIDPRFCVSEQAGVSEWLKSVIGGYPFALYTASFDQRKNHERLIEAFAKVTRRRGLTHKLVIAGNGWPQIYEQLHSIAKRVGLPRSHLVFAGRVTDDQLLELYRNAQLFVFPSLWEGLGMPVLEAMACGAPVVGSNSTSIPEVVGNENALFDPQNVSDMSRVIEKGLFDHDYRAELIRHGQQHSQRFTWANSAKTAWRAIDRLLERPARRIVVSDELRVFADELIALRKSAPDAEDWSSLARGVSRDVADNEITAVRGEEIVGTPRIAWVSSWGNRCGIAAYTESLVDSLEGVSHSIFAHEVGEQIGSSPNVVRCWRPRQPNELTELYEKLAAGHFDLVHIQFNFGFFRADPLNNLIERLTKDGVSVIVTLHATQDPPPEIIPEGLRNYRRGLVSASAVIVHTPRDQDRLAAVEVTQNVIIVPQPAPNVGPLPEDNQSSDEFIVGTYGYFLPKKGLPEIIEAISLARNAGLGCRLLMVNASYHDTGGVSDSLITACKEQALSLGLQDYVTFSTDFLEDAESARQLASANLIVFPYQSTTESSSAAVRMGIATLRPVATTPLEIFSDVEGTTLRLSGTSPVAMAKSIKEIALALRASPKLGVELKRAAKQWLAVNSRNSVTKEHRRLINRVHQNERWIRTYTADFGTLPTNGAVLQGGAIGWPAEHDGLMMHGPYIELDPGLYRIVIKGSVHCTAEMPHQFERTLSSAVFSQLKVTQAAGSETLWDFSENQSFQRESCLIDALFAVSSKAMDVELLCLKKRGSSVSISSYEMFRRV